jgi:hypothetical protein
MSQTLPRVSPARSPTLAVVVEELVAVGAVTPTWPTPTSGAVVTYEVVYEPEGSSAAVDAEGEVTTDTEGVTIVQMDSTLLGNVVQRAVGVVYTPPAGVALQIAEPATRVDSSPGLAVFEELTVTGGVGAKTYSVSAVDLNGDPVTLTDLGGTPQAWEYPALSYGEYFVITHEVADDDGTVVRETQVVGLPALVPRWTLLHSITSFGSNQIFASSGDQTCTATKADGTTFTAAIYCAERLAGTQVWQVLDTDLCVEMQTGSGGSPLAASIGVVFDVSAIPSNAVVRVRMHLQIDGNNNDKLCAYLGAAKTAYPTTSNVPNIQGTIATGDTAIDFDVRLSTTGSSMGQLTSAVGTDLYVVFIIPSFGEAYVQISKDGWPTPSDTTGDLYGKTGQASASATGSTKRSLWGANGNTTMYVAMEAINVGGAAHSRGRLKSCYVEYLDLSEACDAY